MTESDTQLQTALARLAPDVEDVPAWDDVVGRVRTGASFRWRLVAVAVALFVTVGIVAGAVASGLLTGSLDKLSAWVGDQPGEPSPKQQAAFDRENAAAYAQFPTGTRVGRLVHTELEGVDYDLIGFRDGSNLCLRLLPAPLPRQPNPPECVPERELRRVGTPVAVVGGHVRTRFADGSGFTMLYGLASDPVSRVQVVEEGRSLGFAALDNNAFLFAVPDHPRFPMDGPPILLRATGENGAAVDVPLETGPLVSRVDATTFPGPDRVERALKKGSIGWLERGEPRGEPFGFPDHGPQKVVESRLLQPDPASSFRIGVAFSRGTNWQTEGGWYCLAWLWPLVRESESSMCTRAETLDSGLVYAGAWMNSAVQFPLWIGLASDEIARIELIHGDGTTIPVSLVDNVFSFQTRRGEASKLVAYDHDGRVVRAGIVGGEGSGLQGYGIAP